MAVLHQDSNHSEANLRAWSGYSSPPRKFKEAIAEALAELARVEVIAGIFHVGTVNFIDFEYAGLNYAAFDLANHFNEYAGLYGKIVQRTLYF